MKEGNAEELARAVKLVNAGRYAEATKCLKACARGGMTPKVQAVLEWAAQLARTSAGRPTSHPLSAALACGDFDKAFKEAERLLAEDPVGAYRLLRDLWLSGVHEVPVSRARSPWGCFFLSSQCWKQGGTPEALVWLRKGAEAAPRYEWMRYFIAELLLRRLDLYELAKREIETVVKNCPWLWEARCLRAEILWTVGAADPLKGLEAIEVPENSRSSFLAWRGALRLWTGAYAEALPDLDASATLGNPDAPCWRGGTKVMLEDLEGAVNDLNTLLRFDPKDHEARIWRGEAYRRLGRLPESLADLDAALSRNDDAIWALVNRALVHLAQGQDRKAQDDFARLAPPRFDGVRYVCGPLPVKPRRMREVLEKSLACARGCRRSDPHLNFGWMKRNGVALPLRPAPMARLIYWLRGQNVPTPPEMTFGPETVTEPAARAALQGRPAIKRTQRKKVSSRR